MTGSEIEAYTKRSNELAVLCLTMVDPPIKRIELYLKGLAPEIQIHVTSANLDNIQEIQRLDIIKISRCHMALNFWC